MLRSALRTSTILAFGLLVIADTASAPTGSVETSAPVARTNAAAPGGSADRDVAFSPGAGSEAGVNPDSSDRRPASRVPGGGPHVPGSAQPDSHVESWSTMSSGQMADAFAAAGGDYSFSPAHPAGSGSSFGFAGGGGTSGGRGNSFVPSGAPRDAFGGDGLKKDQPVHVPEPTSLVLATCGLSVLWLFWKRERALGRRLARSSGR